MDFIILLHKELYNKIQPTLGYSPPEEILTRNWKLHMNDSSRSNQQLVYPGFDNI